MTAPHLTGLEKLESFESIVSRLRAEQAARLKDCPLVPFPDVEGEDRDMPRLTVWDLVRS